MKTTAATLSRDDALFASTRWTVVQDAAQSGTSDAARDALAELCRIYWRPLYMFVRKQGYPPHDAQDLTQGFFAHLIENRTWTRADRAKGRFRSFLLGALKFFLADAHERQGALKRGGGAIFYELNEEAIAAAETEFARATLRGDEVYDYEWAIALLRQALTRLQRECAMSAKAELFNEVLPYFSATQESAIPYAELGQRLGRAVPTLRTDVARLRRQYREILRDEVRGTVLSDADVDDELRYLYRVLAAGK